MAHERGESRMVIPFCLSDLTRFLDFDENPGDYKLSEVSKLVSYFGARDNRWREVVEIDENWKQAYTSLGRYLRVSGVFVSCYDWVGLKECTDINLRKKALLLDRMNVYTGIFYSVHKYGGDIHWRSASLFIDSGDIDHPERTYNRLLELVHSSASSRLSEEEVREIAEKEHELHLELLSYNPSVKTTCHTADILAGCSKYAHLPSCLPPTFHYKGEVVDVSDRSHYISTVGGELETDLSGLLLSCAINHLLLSTDVYDLVTSCLYPLVGIQYKENEPGLDIECTMLDVARIALEYACMRDDWKEYISKKYGPNQAELVCTTITRWSRRPYRKKEYKRNNLLGDRSYLNRSMAMTEELIIQLP